jgi:hypothetical protein
VGDEYKIGRVRLKVHEISFGNEKEKIEIKIDKSNMKNYESLAVG